MGLLLYPVVQSGPGGLRTAHMAGEVPVGVGYGPGSWGDISLMAPWAQLCPGSGPWGEKLNSALVSC